MRAGGDAVYCAASMGIVRRLREEGIPVCGHSGLIPSQATWTGGFKAVGKTFDSALLVWQQVKALEAAGAFAAEIEVVPAEVASYISARTSLVMISMGAGAGCDAQYLFADDVLGANRKHVPRHARVYRNFAAEYDRLQAQRVARHARQAEDRRVHALHLCLSALDDGADAEATLTVAAHELLRAFPPGCSVGLAEWTIEADGQEPPSQRSRRGPNRHNPAARRACRPCR